MTKIWMVICRRCYTFVDNPIAMTLATLALVAIAAFVTQTIGGWLN